MSQETFIRLPYRSKKQWLKLRKIGGSDASAILGENPWRTNVEAYESLVKQKEGTYTEKDFKPNNLKAIEYGINAEKPLRELFALDYPEYEVSHSKHVLQSLHYDFLTASLDGELTEKSTGKKGVLEIKTTEILSSMAREKWGSVNERLIPQNYYIQCLHYLYVTGYDFFILHVQLKFVYNGHIKTERRSYRWERIEVLEDMKWLILAEVQFWNNHVLQKMPPSRKITF